MPGHPRDLVRLRRRREHRAVRRRPGSREEARDDAAGSFSSTTSRQTVGCSSAGLRKLGDLRRLSVRLILAISPTSTLHGRGPGSGGDTVLFDEMGQSDPSVYLRRTDGSPPKRLAGGARGRPRRTEDSRSLSLVPGPRCSRPDRTRTARLIATPGLRRGGRMGFFPGRRRDWFLAEDSARERRAWAWISTGEASGVTHPGVGGMTLSGDGRFLCAVAADGDWTLYSTETAGTRQGVGILPGEEPIQGNANGRVYVRARTGLRPGETAVHGVYRLDPRTGRRELWKEIPPINPSGGGVIGTIFFSANGKTCVYTHRRYSSELFVVEGLK